MSARPTGASGSSSSPDERKRDWPTPAAANPNDGERLDSWLARRERLRQEYNNGNGCGTPLAIAVQAQQAHRDLDWPTPVANDASNTANATARRTPGSQHHSGVTLVDATRMWPTPTVPGGGRQPKGGMSLTGMTSEGKKRQVDPGHTVREMTARAWPSPRASDGAKGGPNQHGRKGDLMLPSAVHQSQEVQDRDPDGVSAWPTPTVQDAHNLDSPSQRRRKAPGLATTAANGAWATPCSRDYKGQPGASATERGAHAASLPRPVAATGATGQLHPEWVENLVGLPSGWTDVPPAPRKRVREAPVAKARIRRPRKTPACRAATGQLPLF
jgi:hypothetical protein